MMNCFHPGDYRITDRALELCSFKRGDRILEIGCGEGSTMEYLQDKSGFSVIGCDMNEDMIKRAKAKNPKLRIRQCDGSSLDFPSLYFDGAIMECSFSLMQRHTELMHELFCVLKPGANLIISDLYMTQPDPIRAESHRKAAIEFLNRPRNHDDCENEEKYPSPCLMDGMFIKEYLVECVEETGFELLAWEDRTRDLKDYVAQVLMEYGSFENMWKQRLPKNAEVTEFCNINYDKNTGYFLLVAKKRHSK